MRPPVLGSEIRGVNDMKINICARAAEPSLPTTTATKPIQTTHPSALTVGW